MKKETELKIIEVIKKVRELDWMQSINGEPMMHLADVEKAMIGLIEPESKYLERLLQVKKGMDAQNKGVQK